jgi:hypothetical protein
MTPFEEQLKNALKRENPPPGFAGRVMARIPEREPQWGSLFLSMFQLHTTRWALAGIFAFIMIFAVVVHKQREMRERIEGEQARSQVMTALRIASVKLSATRKKVQSIGRKPESLPRSVKSELLKTRS